MIIDETSFNGLMLIPNINEPDPNNRTEYILTELIDICEKEVLSFAFGEVMFADFKENYKTFQPYIDIIDGKTYEIDGKTFIWDGLKDDGQGSLLVDYIWMKYQQHNVTQQTEFGQTSADTKIGKKVSSTPKIVKAWNKFLTKFQAGEFYNGATGLTEEGNPYWIIPRRLGNGYGVSYSGGLNKGGEVSLIQYLNDHRSELPLLDNGTTQFGIQYKNSFGI